MLRYIVLLYLLMIKIEVRKLILLTVEKIMMVNYFSLLLSYVKKKRLKVEKKSLTNKIFHK